MCGFSIFGADPYFNSLQTGRVLVEILWIVLRPLVLLLVLIWCMCSVCASVGDMKNTGVYLGSQSMKSLTGLAD